MALTDRLSFSNHYGPLSREIEVRLHEVLSDPRRFWDRDHGIILRAEPGLHLTLWQAVLAVDSTFPKQGASHDVKGRLVDDWERYPDQMLIGRALRYAAKAQPRRKQQGGE